MVAVEGIKLPIPPRTIPALLVFEVWLVAMSSSEQLTATHYYSLRSLPLSLSSFAQEGLFFFFFKLSGCVPRFVR